MKTTIAIDNELLQQVDETAQLIRITRSHLFAVAVKEFLERHKREQLLLRLNEVYANEIEPLEKRVLNLIKAKVRATVKER